ncbi:uncharacterized protein LOC120341817 [Styela clava]
MEINLLLLLLVLLEFEISLANIDVHTTTPVWQNIDLLAKYLLAFPSLKNLTSEELGFPRGVNFNNPVFQQTTINSNTAVSTERIKLYSTTTETKTQPPSTQDIEKTSIITKRETTTVPTSPSPTTLPMYLTSLPNNSTSFASEVEKPEGFFCHDCSMTPSENTTDCPLRECPERGCVSVILYAIDFTSHNNISATTIIQQCDTGIIQLHEKNFNSTSRDKSPINVNNSTKSFELEAFNISCGNYNVSGQYTSPWKYHHHTVNDSQAYIAKYSCCNFSGCNNFATQDVGEIVQDDSFPNRTINITKNFVDDKTTHIPLYGYQPQNILNATTFMPGVQFTTENTESNLGNATSQSTLFPAYSGSAGGEDVDITTFNFTPTYISTIPEIEELKTTWHALTTMTMDQTSGDMPTSARIDFPLWTTDSPTSGSGIGFERFSTEVGIGTSVAIQTSIGMTISSTSLDYTEQTTFTPITNDMKIEHTNTTTAQNTTTAVTKAEKLTKHTTQTTGTTTNTETNIKTTSIHASNTTWTHYTSTPRKRRSTSPTSFPKLSTSDSIILQTISATTNQNNSTFATNISEQFNTFEIKDVAHQYRVRVLLLISDNDDLTNLTFLLNLESNLLRAYEIAKEKKSISQNAERLSRKLLSINESDTIQIDIVLLQRVTDHAVYVEFAVRENGQYLESRNVVSVLRILSPEELSQILGIPVLSPVIASEVEVASSWMITALTAIPILLLLLILLCCLKFSKRENTNVKKIERRETKIERYPIYTSREVVSTCRRFEDQTTDPKIESPRSVLEQEYEIVDNVKSAAMLPPLPEEQVSHLYASGEFEEIDETKIKNVEEEMPNAICEGTPSINEENYVNSQTLRKQLFENSPPAVSRSNFAEVKESPLVYLPRVSSKTTPLVTQPIVRSWVGDDNEAVSGDGVAEINADLMRIRARMNRTQNAERSRNKRRIRQRISHGERIKTPSPLPSGIHNPFAPVEEKASADPVKVAESPKKIIDEISREGETKVNHVLLAESNDPEKQKRKTSKKRKRRKLLMTILKDWENRHLRNQDNNIEILSPACRLSLDAKMQRWHQSPDISHNDEDECPIQDVKRTNSSPPANAEVRLVRVISVPLNNNTRGDTLLHAN